MKSKMKINIRKQNVCLSAHGTGQNINFGWNQASKKFKCGENILLRNRKRDTEF